ncbi:MAG: alanine racemase [Myxococcales bacterium]|nr:alanine racemase [Myxococcales bacterium]
MPLSYADVVRALSGEPLPALFVDLDAFDRNVERVAAAARGHGITARLASKSLRVPDLLARALERGAPYLRGVMAYSAAEAALLAERGVDDLLLAYPVWQERDLEHVFRALERGRSIAVAVDDPLAVTRWSEAARARGVTVRLVACVDMSLRALGDRVHVGVRRSPLATPADVVALARHARACGGAELVGLLGYEAQIAGLPDAAPEDGRALRLAKALLKRASMRELAARRRAIVAALREAGFELDLVNGGGTGSLEVTSPATGVTETTAGSALFKPHLFDGYESALVRSLEPSCFFALEVTRRATRDVVTCLGGGYVASGPPGRDKAPLPWLPSGLTLLPMEMAGEVQTPVREPPSRAPLALGAPVVFRHAKAGEIAERFSEVLLVSAGRVVGRASTYRGLGACFF